MSTIKILYMKIYFQLLINQLIFAIEIFLWVEKLRKQFCQVMEILRRLMINLYKSANFGWADNQELIECGLSDDVNFVCILQKELNMRMTFLNCFPVNWVLTSVSMISICAKDRRSSWFSILNSSRWTRGQW